MPTEGDSGGIQSSLASLTEDPLQMEGGNHWPAYLGDLRHGSLISMALRLWVWSFNTHTSPHHWLGTCSRRSHSPHHYSWSQGQLLPGTQVASNIWPTICQPGYWNGSLDLLCWRTISLGWDIRSQWLLEAFRLLKLWGNNLKMTWKAGQ